MEKIIELIFSEANFCRKWGKRNISSLSSMHILVVAKNEKSRGGTEMDFGTLKTNMIIKITISLVYANMNLHFVTH